MFGDTSQETMTTSLMQCCVVVVVIVFVVVVAVKVVTVVVVAVVVVDLRVRSGSRRGAKPAKRHQTAGENKEEDDDKRCRAP